MDEPKFKVIFVLGGPGSGKGTQCARIVDQFRFKHLSAGDLLRAERESGSELADMINGFINEGKLVPGEVTINLLKAAMQCEPPGSTFLIDGFPRSMDNLQCFERLLAPLCDIQFTLFFDCPLSTLEERLLARGQTSGRSDDNLETIQKRFKTFEEQSMPVKRYLAQRGYVRTIDATPPPDVVYAETARLITGSQLQGPAPFDASAPVEESLAVLAPSAGVLLGPRVVGALEATGFEVVAFHRARLPARLHSKLHLPPPVATACASDTGGNGQAFAIMVRRAGGVQGLQRFFGMTSTGSSTLLSALGCPDAVHVSTDPVAAQHELRTLFPLEVTEPQRQVPQGASEETTQNLVYLRDCVDPVIVPLFQSILQTKPVDVAGFVLQELHRLPPLVIFGPSGVGKGTLIAKLQESFPDRFGFSVSHTTRAPRPGEQDGVHYHYTDRESMQRDIDSGLFIEHADVHGNMYGTSMAAVTAVQAVGKICILDIDVQGVQRIKQTSLGAKFVLVAPPSLSALEARLRGRGTEVEEKIQTRLRNAKGELDYGYGAGNADRIVVNDDLESAIADLQATVSAWFPGLACAE